MKRPLRFLSTKTTISSNNISGELSWNTTLLHSLLRHHLGEVRKIVTQEAVKLCNILSKWMSILNKLFSLTFQWFRLLLGGFYTNLGLEGCLLWSNWACAYMLYQKKYLVDRSTVQFKKLGSIEIKLINMETFM